MNEPKMPTIDTDAIEEAITSSLRSPVQLHPIPTPETPMRTAMRNVDRHVNRENLAIEAFVDEAIHLRIAMMRGSYKPGPRDSHVRRLVLETIMSISATNGSDLEL